MKTKMMTLSALFAALTAIGAFIRIPTFITYVTLQTFFTAMSGALLGKKWGAAAQGVYVLLGLMGLPIFTSGGGITYIFNPACGFLFGLIPAAWVIGKMSEGEFLVKKTVLACLAGFGVIYIIGVPYMYAVCNLYLDMELSIWYVVKAGVLIFLPGDLLKITATVWLSKRLVPRLRKYSS